MVRQRPRIPRARCSRAAQRHHHRGRHRQQLRKLDDAVSSPRSTSGARLPPADPSASPALLTIVGSQLAQGADGELTRRAPCACGPARDRAQARRQAPARAARRPRARPSRGSWATTSSQRSAALGDEVGEAGNGAVQLGALLLRAGGKPELGVADPRARPRQRRPARRRPRRGGDRRGRAAGRRPRSPGQEVRRFVAAICVVLVLVSTRTLSADQRASSSPGAKPARRHPAERHCLVAGQPGPVAVVVAAHPPPRPPRALPAMARAGRARPAPLASVGCACAGDPGSRHPLSPRAARPPRRTATRNASGGADAPGLTEGRQDLRQPDAGGAAQRAGVDAGTSRSATRSAVRGRSMSPAAIAATSCASVGGSSPSPHRRRRRHRRRAPRAPATRPRPPPRAPRSGSHDGGHHHDARWHLTRPLATPDPDRRGGTCALPSGNVFDDPASAFLFGARPPPRARPPVPWRGRAPGPSRGWRCPAGDITPRPRVTGTARSSVIDDGPWYWAHSPRRILRCFRSSAPADDTTAARHVAGERPADTPVRNGDHDHAALGRQRVGRPACGLFVEVGSRIGWRGSQLRWKSIAGRGYVLNRAPRPHKGRPEPAWSRTAGVKSFEPGSINDRQGWPKPSARARSRSAPWSAAPTFWSISPSETLIAASRSCTRPTSAGWWRRPSRPRPPAEDSLPWSGAATASWSARGHRRPSVSRSPSSCRPGPALSCSRCSCFSVAVHAPGGQRRRPLRLVTASAAGTEHRDDRLARRSADAAHLNAPGAAFARPSTRAMLAAQTSVVPCAARRAHLDRGQFHRGAHRTRPPS